MKKLTRLVKAKKVRHKREDTKGNYASYSISDSTTTIIHTASTSASVSTAALTFHGAAPSTSASVSDVADADATTSTSTSGGAVSAATASATAAARVTAVFLTCCFFWRAEAKGEEPGKK